MFLPTVQHGYDDYTTTQLLLHMDGANGGTTFTDSSKNAFTVTPTNATTSTTQTKFGATSGYFDAAADSRLSIADNSLLRQDVPFCLDMWIYLTDVTTTGWLWSKGNGSSYAPLSLYVGSGNLNGLSSANGTTWGIFSTPGMGAVSANTWTHVAIQWTGSEWRSFINGVSSWSLSSSTTPYEAANAQVVGNQQTFANRTKGYIDEVRFRQGVAFPSGGFPVKLSSYRRG